MKTLNLLLGNQEELVNDIIATMLEADCVEVGRTECTMAAQMNEFVLQACTKDFDLAIFIPSGNLLGDMQQPPNAPLEQAVQVVRRIRSKRSMPIIVVVGGDVAGYEPVLLEEGADYVLDWSDSGQLKVAIAECLHLPLRIQPPEALDTTWAGAV